LATGPAETTELGYKTPARSAISATRADEKEAGEEWVEAGENVAYGLGRRLAVSCCQRSAKRSKTSEMSSSSASE
jgi:hypothetical protein